MDEETFIHPPYPKSDREIKINKLCELIQSTEGEEKKKYQMELLDFIEKKPEAALKIVLFNGPPRSGKDTATQLALHYLGERGFFCRFAGPLKDAVHALFGLSRIQQEHFDSIKDKASPQFFGMSPREAYIWMSELLVKPKFGNDFFANVAVNTIKSLQCQTENNRVVVISDLGFNEEADTLVKAFGWDNVAIIHMKREGTSFNNDSRSYVFNNQCKHYEIKNDGTVEQLNENVKSILRDFYAGN